MVYKLYLMTTNHKSLASFKEKIPHIQLIIAKWLNNYFEPNYKVT
jgi:hypothetical protein